MSETRGWADGCPTDDEKADEGGWSWACGDHVNAHTVYVCMALGLVCVYNIYIYVYIYRSG